jgi:hypothetical protein
MVVGWIRGVPWLEQHVTAAAEPDALQIEFVDLPAWVDGDLLAKLELDVLRNIAADPLDQAGLVVARQALLNSGWFESVAQVRRVRNDLIQVRGTFVRPFAVIRDEDGDHLVDLHGRLLPLTYPREQSDASGRPTVRHFVISGVHFERPLRAGMQWEGEDVTAALRLLRLIEDKPGLEQIDAIDTSRFFREGALLIRTDAGATMIWGSAPGDEAPGEITAARKISYLDEAYREYDRIDLGYAGEWEFLEKGLFVE